MASNPLKLPVSPTRAGTGGTFAFRASTLGVDVGEPLRKPLDAPMLGHVESRPAYTASELARTLSHLGKAVFDIALGTFLALMALPVIIVLALILAVRMRQWPFFGHTRLIHGGRMVAFPKLRTLPKSTPRYALKDGGKVIPVDRFCAFLRHRHLDELPQLLLVPVLRMSLVGPRPKMPDRFEPTHPGYRDARCLVRQGCTGLWQIGHESHQLVHERPEYDFSYLQYGSLRMDLWILWRTALLMIGGRAIQLEEVPRWVIGSGWVSDDDIRAVGGAKFLVPRHRIASPARVERRRSDPVGG